MQCTMEIQDWLIIRFEYQEVIAFSLHILKTRDTNSDNNLFNDNKKCRRRMNTLSF